jgi:RNA polymerase sigma factor (sigma-70 family)
MAELTPKERFQAVILPHVNSAFNLACWLTRNRADAEDVVQEACLRAFKFFRGFHGPDGRVWLLRIVRNTFYTMYQESHAQQQRTAFDEDIHSFAAMHDGATGRADNNPEALLLDKDCDRLIQQALASMPLEFREVMVMRELEELSYKEIASVVGIPIGTVMSRLGRGRKLLATTLAQLYQGE